MSPQRNVWLPSKRKPKRKGACVVPRRRVRKALAGKQGGS